MHNVGFRSLPTVLFLTTASLLSAQEKPTVSVIPFTTENVSKPEASTITRLFEAALVKMNAFTVLEQSDADQILKAQEYSMANCTDEACAIEIGKLLSALTDRLKDVAEAMRGAGMTTAGKASIIAEEEGGESGAVPISSAQASSSFVTFDSDPPAVAFTLYDTTGALMTKAVTSKALRLSFGRVTVKAQDDAGLYYPFEDTLDVGADSPRKFTFKIQMKPNFGAVQIGSAPAGAQITKDGMRLGVTPFRIDRLKSGSHTFVRAIARGRGEGRKASHAAEAARTDRIPGPWRYVVFGPICPASRGGYRATTGAHGARLSYPWVNGAFFDSFSRCNVPGRL